MALGAIGRPDDGAFPTSSLPCRVSGIYFGRDNQSIRNTGMFED